MSAAVVTVHRDSPFLLSNAQAYAAWRQEKLHNYPRCAAELLVAIANPLDLSAQEYRDIMQRLRKTNLALYTVTSQQATDKNRLRQLGRQFGLEQLDSNICADEDSISSLRVMQSGRHQGYIPYTDRALSWHTDGYYNPPDKQIRALLMHCDTPAVEGGANMYLDHEILYLTLRDANPDYISALSRPDVMTIPANVEEGDEIRAAQTGPVFSIDNRGNLHMRYSARTRNIQWRDDALTVDAVAQIQSLLNGDLPYIIRYRLAANQGIICNNVLHNRTAFVDGTTQLTKRLLYRARYFDRVRNTDLPSEQKGWSCSG
jgi:alpha-ketoglutarate-dependent taurine dioxygenase